MDDKELEELLRAYEGASPRPETKHAIMQAARQTRTQRTAPADGSLFISAPESNRRWLWVFCALAACIMLALVFWRVLPSSSPVATVSVQQAKVNQERETPPANENERAEPASAAQTPDQNNPEPEIAGNETMPDQAPQAVLVKPDEPARLQAQLPPETGIAVRRPAAEAPVLFHKAADTDKTAKAAPPVSKAVNAPVINSDLSADATVGAAFTYSITSMNNATSYAATGLPTGLSINPKTGVIFGTPTAAGTSNITISASNAGGSGTAILELSITDPAARYVLTVTTAGNGSGTITLVPGGGVYAPGTVVSLTAIPDDGSNFIGWAGMGTGNAATLTLAMNTNFIVTGIFNNLNIANTYVLLVYGGTGSGSYTPGTIVNIAANPAPAGQAFSVWTGSNAINNPHAAATAIIMPSTNIAITASYAAGGGGNTGGGNLLVGTLSGNVGFKNGGHDACEITGAIPGIACGYETANVAATLNVGGAQVVFKLSAKGEGRTGNCLFILTPPPVKFDKKTKKPIPGVGTAAFTATLNNGSWANAWAAEGINATTAKGKVVNMPVRLTLGSTLYSTSASVTYEGEPGSGGSFKK